MIDITAEQPITMREAARLYGSSRDGRPTHVSTIVRHIVRGTRLRSGEIVRLEGARIGGKWVTTRQSIQRYVERLTAAVLTEGDLAGVPTISSSTRRQRELKRVDHELDEAGITSTPGRRSRPRRTTSNPSES
jgi:hypothetical protein